jgi:hypothetical protein
MTQGEKRSMTEEEGYAEEYLKFRGFRNIIFEPHCSRTPDFLVDGRIAVEVRRLNQYTKTKSGDLEALGKLGKPLRERLQELLKSFGPPTNGVSWQVSCR